MDKLNFIKQLISGGATSDTIRGLGLGSLLNKNKTADSKEDSGNLQNSDTEEGSRVGEDYRRIVGPPAGKEAAGEAGRKD